MTRALFAFAFAAALLLAAPPPARAAGPSERAEKQRRYFTDTVLVDQDGRKVRFFEDVLAGQVVVIDFVFTRCTGACPLLTRKLLQVRSELGEGSGRAVRFVSISVDPQHDGPAELRGFARKHGADVPGWTFLTGKKADVDLVVKKLGQYVEAIEDHSTVFIAGNARTGHWTRMRPDASPKVIAERLREMLAEDPGGPVAAKN